MAPPSVSPVATPSGVALPAVPPSTAAALPPVAGGADPAIPPAVPGEAVEAAADIRRAIGELTEVLRTTSIGLRFEIDEATNRVVTKVIDKETGELIRQMPTEEVLRFARALDRLQGVFVRQAA
ncbi:flagellar biosynthesis protein FlaG [Cupriavidus gilardii]|uniref:flagellar protein FlaG n=1 Tax=Cupriavidus gilardii TaxID=82541 RepID=UPI001EE4EF8A|nr:flagellar protein FlaG [Cupriavidus gilardii]MCG5261809.1 flagellar protein FlaG [Cupriavidus gilardii]MDF9429755.1 flagellar biosynthesis protein FlaG [Cupriavidus gilardii]